jgi:hypothetical protein
VYDYWRLAFDTFCRDTHSVLTGMYARLRTFLYTNARVTPSLPLDKKLASSALGTRHATTHPIFLPISRGLHRVTQTAS